MKEVICEIIPGLTLNGEILSEFYHPVDNLVRCKDCKKEVWCRRHWDKDEDWFCADGERKDGDGE